MPRLDDGSVGDDGQIDAFTGFRRRQAEVVHGQALGRAQSTEIPQRPPWDDGHGLPSMEYMVKYV